MYMRYPLGYIVITQYLHTGKCLDFGWSDSYGGRTAPVYAIADGVVYESRWNGVGGNQIFIDHSNGMRSGYTHLSERFVKPGDSVVMGQEIGRMGNTGTGANGQYHLHFALLKQDGDLDYGDYNPLDYLYIYPGQVVNSNTLKQYGSQIKYYSQNDNDYWYVYNVDDEGLNVRNAPNGSLIDNICFGTPVRVYETSGSWSRVGTNKWVYSAYLTRNEPLAYMVDSSDGLNVRNKPSTSGTLLRLMPHGTIVGIYSTSGTWAKISPNSERWCSKNYLTGICPIPYQ